MEIVVFYQILIIIFGLFSSLFVLSQARDYIGNRLIATSFFLLGVFGMVNAIYATLGGENLSLVMSKMGFIALLFSVYLLSLGIENYTKVAPTDKLMRFWMIFPISLTIFSVVSFTTEFLVVIDPEPPVNIVFNMEHPMKTLAYFGFYLSMILILLLRALSRAIIALKRVDGVQKTQMTFFLVGIITFIFSLLDVLLSNIWKDISLLDSLIYLFIDLVIVLLVIGIFKSPHKKSTVSL